VQCIIRNRSTQDFTKEGFRRVRSRHFQENSRARMSESRYAPVGSRGQPMPNV